MNPFFSPKYVEATVNGNLHKFYASRVWVLGQLKGFLKPLFQGLAALSATYGSDTGKESVETKSGPDNYQLRTSITAIDPKLDAQRSAQRKALVDSLVEELASEPAMRCLAVLIMDSMRDDFPKRPDDQKAREFVQDVDLNTMVEMLKGVAQANKEVFAPLTERASGLLGALKGRFQAANDDVQEQPSEPQEPQPPKETQETSSGSSSS